MEIQIPDHKPVMTIVSVVPLTLNEKKPGLFPGEFNIPAVKDYRTDFAILHIEEGIHYVYVGADFPLMTVRTAAHEIARAICEDWINAQLGINPEAYPGLFALPGRLTKDDVAKNYKEHLEAARRRQEQWFLALITIADDDWSKTHQHMLITDIQRAACKSLGMTRDWLVELPAQSLLDKCPACNTPYIAGAVLCQNCRFIIDRVGYDKIKDRFAAVT